MNQDLQGTLAKGSSKFYVLGCVVVRASHWAEAFENLSGYRQYLKTEFGLPVRAEIKANYLLQNGGPFGVLSLSETARHSVYRGMLRLCFRHHIKAFAIVIRKELLVEKDVHDLAWMLLLQTLQRLMSNQEQQVVLFHMWEELGAALADVNDPSDSSRRGIVEWPRHK